MFIQHRYSLRAIYSRQKEIFTTTVLAFLLLIVPFQVYSAEVELTWDPNQELDLAGYRLYYGTASGEYSETINVGNTTTYNVTDLEFGITYYFAVAAYDISGNESDYSQEFSDTLFDVDSGDDDSQDSDGDGMPDEWETQYGLDPLSDDALADGDDDGISNLDEYLGGTDPGIYDENAEPDAPVLYTEVAEQGMSLTPLLQTKAFYDPDFGDTHRQTQWQIIREADETIVLDITSNSALTALSVPKLILDEDSAYVWQAKFYDNHGTESQWSETAGFTTDLQTEDTDRNGIPDDQEVDVTLDLDGDDTADRDQADIKCVNISGGDRQVCISFKDSAVVVAIEALESADANDPQFKGEADGKPANMPFGLIHFKLTVNEPGAEAAVKVYLSEPAPADSIWYKFNPITASWQDYSDYAEFSEDRKSITLFFQDGGFGDLDGTANGIIIDPSGLGAAKASSDGGGGSSGVFDNPVSNASCFIATATQQPKKIRSMNLWFNVCGRQLVIPFLLLIAFTVSLKLILKRKILSLH